MWPSTPSLAPASLSGPCHQGTPASGPRPCRPTKKALLLSRGRGRKGKVPYGSWQLPQSDSPCQAAPCRVTSPLFRHGEGFLSPTVLFLAFWLLSALQKWDVRDLATAIFTMPARDHRCFPKWWLQFILGGGAGGGRESSEALSSSAELGSRQHKLIEYFLLTKLTT